MAVSQEREVKDVSGSIVATCLWLLALCSVQLPSGQLLAVGAVAVLATLLLFLALAKRSNLDVRSLACFLVWCAMIVYLIRPMYAADVEAAIEASWLTLGAVVLLASTVSAGNVEVNPSVVYNAAFMGAVLIVLSMLTGSTLGGLVNLAYAGTRQVGGFDGPNEMGAFHVLGLSLMLGEHLFRSRVSLFPIKAAVFATAVVFSWSRGAFAVLVIMYVLSFCWVLLKLKGQRRVRYALGFILVAAILVVLFFRVLEPMLRSVRRNAGDRWYLFHTVWEIFNLNPVFGHGLGSYWFLSDAMNVTPHSTYFLFTVSGGLVGLALIVGLYVYWIGLAVRKGMYPEALALSVFCFLEAFFNNIVRGRVSLLFWGLVFAVLVKKPSSRDRYVMLSRRRT